MGRESWGRRALLTVHFLLLYVYTLIFVDLPQTLFSRKKNIEDQVVVITGGAMGIGRELARKFALKHGAKVCVLDINQTVAEIRAEGGIAVFFSCDVSSLESLQLVAASIESDPKLGAVHILICNAAILRFGSLLELGEKDYRVNNDVNILGHIFTVKAFLPRMLKEDRGHIVSMGSICSHYGGEFGTAYCTSKFAIRGFMESLQMELLGLDKRIVLTSIFPYFVNTTLLSDLEEPFSTFYDVVGVDECTEQIVEGVLRERFEVFIPSSLASFCTFAKCMTTKNAIPLGRRFFNFQYRPKPKLPVQEV